MRPSIPPLFASGKERGLSPCPVVARLKRRDGPRLGMSSRERSWRPAALCCVSVKQCRAGCGKRCCSPAKRQQMELL